LIPLIKDTAIHSSVVVWVEMCFDIEVIDQFDNMVEQFTGMAVSLTLSKSAQLRGTVSKVDSTTQILHLRDGISFPYSSI
jgi:hypothetical protein